MFNWVWDLIHNNAREIIALSALGLAVSQGMATRKHNKLTVKPHLTFVRWIEQDKRYIKLTLKNDGVGPAFINHFKVHLDDKEVTSKGQNSVAKALNLLNVPGAITVLGFSYKKNDSISSKSEETIIQIYLSPEMDFDKRLLGNQLDRLRIEIEYTCLYRKKYSVVEMST